MRRVLQSEKRSFVPLVVTRSGGMGPPCTVFVDHFSEIIADQKKEAESQVKNHIVSFRKHTHSTQGNQMKTNSAAFWTD